MPSTLRSLATFSLPLLALNILPSSLGGQQLSAHATVQVRVTVQPVVAIRRVVTTTASHTGAIIDVESNLPYRLIVRLAPSTMAENARVLVRGVNGIFESLETNGSVTAAVATPGQRRHEVFCRVETPAMARCALIYELSAEYHDSLIRSSARSE
jgi:hypothetical protein